MLQRPEFSGASYGRLRALAWCLAGRRPWPQAPTLPGGKGGGEAGPQRWNWVSPDGSPKPTSFLEMAGQVISRYSFRLVTEGRIGPGNGGSREIRWEQRSPGVVSWGSHPEWGTVAQASSPSPGRAWPDGVTPERTCPPGSESRKLEQRGAVHASGEAERLTVSARAGTRGDVAPSNTGGGDDLQAFIVEEKKAAPPQNNVGVHRPQHPLPWARGVSSPDVHCGLRFLGAKSRKRARCPAQGTG